MFLRHTDLSSDDDGDGSDDDEASGEDDAMEVGSSNDDESSADDDDQAESDAGSADSSEAESSHDDDDSAVAIIKPSSHPGAPTVGSTSSRIHNHYSHLAPATLQLLQKAQKAYASSKAQVCLLPMIMMYDNTDCFFCS